MLVLVSLEEFKEHKQRIFFVGLMGELERSSTTFGDVYAEYP